jgi:hypothetical protein
LWKGNTNRVEAERLALELGSDSPFSAIARNAELRPVVMRTPFALWDAVAGLAEILPHPPLTRNQVELMQIDTTASGNLPGFRELGISPRSLEEELEAMLKQSNTETQSPNRRRGS